MSATRCWLCRWRLRYGWAVGEGIPILPFYPCAPAHEPRRPSALLTTVSRRRRMARGPRAVRASGPLANGRRVECRARGIESDDALERLRHEVPDHPHGTARRHPPDDVSHRRRAPAVGSLAARRVPQAFRDVGSDPDNKVVILTGTGDTYSGPRAPAAPACAARRRSGIACTGRASIC
jgi:hypothetical protein